jgi:hypothetical protein
MVETRHFSEGQDMYTDINFKTKKALKEAVAAWNDAVAFGQPQVAQPVRIHQPNGDLTRTVAPNGTAFLEGPHYPAPHTWYAQATMKDGIVVKVK